MRRTSLVALGLALLLLGGCQPVNFEQTYDLNPVQNLAKGAGFQAPRYEQKVKVTITPSEAGLSAYLIKDPDLKLADNPPERVPPDLILASKVGAGKEEFTLEATVPAKTPYTVLLYPNRKMTAKVKLTGR
jgi:hypothetical protein